MIALSLRFRLALVLAGVLALLLALDAALTLRGAGRRVDPELADATALTRDVLSEAIKNVPPGPDAAARLAALAASLDRLRHVRVAYAAPGADFAPAPPRPGPPQAFVALVRPRAETSTIPVEIGGAPAGRFRIEGDPADELEELWESLVTLALDGALSAALGFGLVYLAAGRALRPLARLNAGLEALGRGEYDARLASEGASDYAPLLARFNALGEKLKAAERDNRALRARLVSIQDEERREIARELHDEIGPHLFAARAQAGAARDGAPAEIKGLIETLDALQMVNRRILDRLRPAALEELGLGPALAALARFFERQPGGLRVTVEVGPLPPLAAGLETALYRIAQEALTNAARHAGATRAEVTLTLGPALALRVADDGRGLAADATPGRGQIGMRERAAAYGGALELRPNRPRGLVVEATFPAP